MPIEPATSIPALVWAKPSRVPYVMKPTIRCDNCRSYQPRAGHIKVSIDRLHQRVLCARCASNMGLP